jgi:hypothetical protein
MMFCNTHGIPHSKFLEWDQTDQNKAIAYLYEEGTRCGMCGTADWEWEQEDELGIVRPVRAYEPTGHFCMGCYLKSVAGEETGNEPGQSIRLIPTNSVEAAKKYLVEERAWEMRMSGDDDG